ncbi:hypothetical protein LTR95_017612 [Oleoguttula sp. CCFEE 5521]
MGPSVVIVVALTLCVSSLAGAHSYVIDTRMLVNGDFTDAHGYSRGYVNPKTPSYDSQMTHLLPSDQNSTISVTDMMCRDTQRGHNQTETYPVLQARLGDQVVLRYKENGHIGRPLPGKLTFGTVSVYGTTQPDPGDTFLGIHHVWNRNQTGGDRRGQLLARQSFDDGSCYTANGSPLLTARAPDLPRAVEDNVDVIAGEAALGPVQPRARSRSMAEIRFSRAAMCALTAASSRAPLLSQRQPMESDEEREESVQTIYFMMESQLRKPKENSMPNSVPLIV